MTSRAGTTLAAIFVVTLAWGCGGSGPSSPSNYTITFGNSCNTVQFTLLADPCDGRRPFIAGSTLTRQ